MSYILRTPDHKAFSPSCFNNGSQYVTAGKSQHPTVDNLGRCLPPHVEPPCQQAHNFPAPSSDRHFAVSLTSHAGPQQTLDITQFDCS